MSIKSRMRWLDKQGHVIKRSRADLEKLYGFLMKRRPISGMIEIGCLHGATLYTFADAVAKGSPIIAIDLFYIKHTQQVKSERKTRQTMRELAKEGHKVTLLKRDSRKAVDEVKALLKGRTVGLLHIDGGHSYEVARSDFDKYLPFVAKGGVVLMHDVMNENTAVPKVWAELKEQYGDRAVLLTDIKGEGSGVILL